MTNDLSQDQRMHRICASLSSAGFEVLLVGRQLQDSLALEEYSFQTKRLRCFFNSGLLFYAEYNLRLFLYLLFQSVEVINSVDLDTLIAGRLASALKRKRFMFDAHELFTEVPELENKPFKKWIWSIVERGVVKGNMSCYTVNRYLAKELLKRTGKEFDVIYNYPIAQKISGPRDIQTPIQLVYQGVLNAGRGLEEMITAVGSDDKYSLHIIGRGDIENEIKDSASLHTNIHFHGFVSPSQLHKLTSQFDIGLNLLSDRSHNYVYSSANKFFDYIMAGIPVISMDFPEYRQVNDEYEIGILIDNLSQESIITAIDLISQQYRRFSQHCAEASKELNWSGEAKKLLEIYGLPILQI